MASSRVSRSGLRAGVFIAVLAILFFETRGSTETLVQAPEASTTATAPPVQVPIRTFKRPERPAAKPVNAVQLPADGAPAEAVAASEEEAPEPTPVPDEIDLDDLDEDERRELGDSAMAQIRELADACDPYATEPMNAVARVTVDPDGLLEMALSAYGDSPDLSQELSDCLDGVLWDQEWVGAPEGTELSFELSLRMGRE